MDSCRSVSSVLVSAAAPEPKPKRVVLGESVESSCNTNLAPGQAVHVLCCMKDLHNAVSDSVSKALNKAGLPLHTCPSARLTCW